MKPQLLTALRVKNGEIKDIAGLTTWSGTVDIGVGQGIFGDDCIWLYKTNTGASEHNKPYKYLYSDRGDIWNFGTSDFTVSFYFKISTTEEFPNADDSLANSMPFLNCIDDPTKLLYIRYYYPDSRFDIAIGHPTSRTYLYDRDTDISVSHETMANGQWHHMAWTRKQNITYIFFDGILQHSIDIGDLDLNYQNSRLSIGIVNDTGAHANTLIDDFTIIKDLCLWEDSFEYPKTHLINLVLNKRLTNNLKVGD